MVNCAKETEEKIRQELFALKDAGYKEFHRKLIPTVNPDTIIGIRTPVLRKYAKQLYKERKADALIFMQALPHRYYEENNLHGCFIECMNDYDAVIGALNAFLPYVDNWATCDLISPKVDDVKAHLHRPVWNGNADALLSGRRIFVGVSGNGSVCCVGGILCKNDGGMVFCHGTGKTV